jgi:prepilin-type N-terminal cleavage/methylation domain-containing protein
MSPSRSRRRAGFTLVEMLVAVALVVIMMTLFATVFQLATGAMSKQKGFAQNDQRARLTQTLLKADLDKRTFRSVFAWKRKEDSLDAAIPPSLRQGYVYISENDPLDDTDDLLQFTVSTSMQLKNKDTTALYGRTVPLKHSSISPNMMQTMQQCVEDYALNNPNQPELDDGQVNLDNTGLSTVAEICYFLRNGTLYRRVMLVRTPYIGNQITPYGYDNTGAIKELIDGKYRHTGASMNPPAFAPTGSGVFWRDFDYSAVNMEGLDPSGTIDPTKDLPTFLGASTGASNYLSNAYVSATVGDHVPSLGMPNMRWGFSPALKSSTAGRPREYANQYKTTASGTVQTGDAFIGRYTHAETSNNAFLYPGTLDNGDPFSTSVDRTLILDSGALVELPSGPRRGEDILLTNVHAFDIKVYDDVIQDFVDLGNAATGSAAGDYSRTNSNNKDYGPRPVGNVGNNVFDTWHPDFDADNNAGTAMAPDDEQPPYRPWGKGADGQWGVAGTNDDGLGGTDDIAEAGWPDSDDQPRPLKSIQIRLRYLDTTSNQMRDLTIIQSLTD